jgi:retinol-binding protein 3
MTQALLLIALLAQQQAATAATDAATIDAVAAAVEQRYVVPETGTKIAAYIRDRAAKGTYAGLTGGPLADALTQDLRAENGDRHLSVQYQPGASGAPTPASPGGPVRMVPGSSPGQTDLYRRRNYFLNRAERLDGNIGYLEVRRFFGLSEDALDAAAAAMAFLENTDAFIIDVRYAPGGDVRMVDTLASYFFDKVTPTLATYWRSRNETTQRATLENLPGKRRPDIPVYVLISRDTGSAAEDFAFLLQQTGRATLVGDRTAGAGHTNAVLGLGGGYSLSVSIGRTFNPKTNQGWEAVGVRPDVQAAAADAVDTAHRLALTALIEKLEKAGGTALRTELGWTRDALDARRKPPAVDAKILQELAGHYGVRAIVFADGRLWYQRQEGAEKIPLTTLSATEFAMGEGQRMQFVRTGGSLELRLLNTDGSHVAFPRAR